MVLCYKGSFIKIRSSYSEFLGLEDDEYILEFISDRQAVLTISRSIRKENCSK